MCEHLRAHRAEDDDLPEWLIAFDGPEFRPMCRACVNAATPPAAEVCDACRCAFLRVDHYGSFDGFGGEPAPRDRDAGLSFVIETVDVRAALQGRILALAPVPSGGRPLWAAWTSERRVVTFELPSGTVHATSEVVPEDAFPEPLAEESRRGPPTPTLHVSRDGRTAAVLMERTPHGVLLDLGTGELRRRLHRGTYHVDVSGWAFAFLERDGRGLFVHAADWNSLAATWCDSLEAVRAPDLANNFLCRLSMSPGGKWIASAGWAWQPWGMVEVRALDRWLGGAEAPARVLNGTGYHWDGPNVWLDDDRLLVWGIGDNDQGMVDGGIVYSPHDGSVVGYFPALPMASLHLDRAAGQVWSCGVQGTAVWDAATGDRLCSSDASTSAFHPLARHAAGFDADGRLTLAFLQKR